MDFQQPEKPLVAGLAKVVKEKPEETFWFERDDGYVFACNEKQAWEILKGRVRKIGKKHSYKLISVSTGEIYFTALKEMQVIFREKGLEDAQDFIRQKQQEELDSGRERVRMPKNNDILGDEKAKEALAGGQFSNIRLG